MRSIASRDNEEEYMQTDGASVCDDCIRKIESSDLIVCNIPKHSSGTVCVIRSIATKFLEELN